MAERRMSGHGGGGRVGGRAAGRVAACALAVGMAILASGCRGRDAAGSFAQELEAARAAKDQAFRSSPDSPVPSDRRGQILPLRYFPPDPSYRVPAVFEPAAADKDANLVMTTSTGKLRAMVRVGVLEFTLKGRRLKLAAYVEAGTPSIDRLFVPFTDLTTGTETYGGGRYLDLDRTPTGIYVLDFNLAYNPYCAYNPTYDCPYPPQENRLPIAIRAGEKGG